MNAPASVPWPQGQLWGPAPGSGVPRVPPKDVNYLTVGSSRFPLWSARHDIDSKGKSGRPGRAAWLQRVTYLVLVTTYPKCPENASGSFLTGTKLRNSLSPSLLP